MRISDWSSDVCSSDLLPSLLVAHHGLCEVRDGGGNAIPDESHRLVDERLEERLLDALLVRCAELDHVHSDALLEHTRRELFSRETTATKPITSNTPGDINPTPTKTKTKTTPTNQTTDQ